MTATRTNQLSEAICFIRFPLSLIYITIFVNDSAFAVAHIIEKIAFVDIAVWPDLVALALPEVSVEEPFTLVL